MLQGLIRCFEIKNVPSLSFTSSLVASFAHWVVADHVLETRTKETMLKFSKVGRLVGRAGVTDDVCVLLCLPGAAWQSDQKIKHLDHRNGIFPNILEINVFLKSKKTLRKCLTCRSKRRRMTSFYVRAGAQNNPEKAKENPSEHRKERQIWREINPFLLHVSKTFMKESSSHWCSTGFSSKLFAHFYFYCFLCFFLSPPHYHYLTVTAQ